MPKFELNPAQCWARRAQSEAVFTSGPLNMRRICKALNTESRQVLFELAGTVKSNSNVAVIDLSSLVKATGFSLKRINWCFSALRAAHLIGPYDQEQVGGRVYLRVTLNFKGAR